MLTSLRVVEWWCYGFMHADVCAAQRCTANVCLGVCMLLVNLTCGCRLLQSVTLPAYQHVILCNLQYA